MLAACQATWRSCYYFKQVATHHYSTDLTHRAADHNTAAGAAQPCRSSNLSLPRMLLPWLLLLQRCRMDLIQELLLLSPLLRPMALPARCCMPCYRHGRLLLPLVLLLPHSSLVVASVVVLVPFLLMCCCSLRLRWSPTHHTLEVCCVSHNRPQQQLRPAVNHPNARSPPEHIKLHIHLLP